MGATQMSAPIFLEKRADRSVFVGTSNDPMTLDSALYCSGPSGSLGIGNEKISMPSSASSRASSCEV
jgi:hypothetical protein